MKFKHTKQLLFFIAGSIQQLLRGALALTLASETSAPPLFFENLLVCSVKSNNGINAQLSVLPNIKTALVGFQKGDFFKGKQEAEVEKKAANTGPGAKDFAK